MVYIEMVMSTSLKLARYFDDCPLAWQNFILALHYDPSEDAIDVVIQNALSEFDATYVESSPVDYVKFESANKLTWFMLKWS
jgi:hypothetical protein